jgi:hypothetical protein
MKQTVQNEARRAPLSGRPCIRPYHDVSDLLGLVDKESFSRMHHEKWGGAPWLDEDMGTDAGGGGAGVILLDTVPASCPTSSVSSSVASSKQSSRPTTDET